MCRLLGYCSRDAASVAELLGTESFRAFTSLSDLHGDGWGMAWYAGSRPAAWKSAARAGREPEYDKLAWQPLGDLGLVHLRWATPGLAVSDVNTHPFRYGDYTFAHNGAIYPQERLGEMLPPEWERRLAGSTDSERYFLHLMWRLAERDGDMVAAIADTTAAISQRYTASSLNAILLAPDALYAISFHDRSMVPADLLRELGHGERPRGGRRLLRPGLPGHRRRRSRGELGLADARLDAAAVGARAGHRPAHASHVRPRRSRPRYRGDAGCSR